MGEGAFRICRNDIVRIMAGKEKGKVGRVLKVDRARGRIFVEKVNMVKRHVRPGKAHPQGGVVEKEAPVAYSNVLIMCDKCNKPTRIGIAVEAGEKTRVCKRCGAALERKKR